MIQYLSSPAEFKRKALQWASGFDVCCYLDSNDFDDSYGKFDSLIAVGVKDEIAAQSGSAFDQLQRFRDQNPGWMTGFFTYDLKNEIEELNSENQDNLGFPGLYFFVPQYLLIFQKNKVEIIADDAAGIFKSIAGQVLSCEPGEAMVDIRSRLSKACYIEAVEKIQGHINREIFT